MGAGPSPEANRTNTSLVAVRDDRDAAAHRGDVMAGMLAPGLRRVEALDPIFHQET
jgi:hypothetical protein